MNKISMMFGAIWAKENKVFFFISSFIFVRTGTWFNDHASFLHLYRFLLVHLCLWLKKVLTTLFINCLQ